MPETDTSTITTKQGGKDVVLKPGETAGGVTYEGRDILGARENEINRVNQIRATQGLSPLSAEEAPYTQLEGIKQSQEQSAQVESLLSPLTAEEIAQAQAGVTDAPANLKQALIAGTLGSGPSIIGATVGGATAGATAGALGGPGGALVLGAAGGAAGFAGAVYAGVRGNIKSQQKGEIQAAQDYLTNGKTSATKLAMMARQYPELAPQFAQDYRDLELTMIRKREQIKAETSGDLNSWMEDGRAELSDFDSFLSTTSPIIKERMRLAANGGLPPMSDAEFQMALMLIDQ